MNAKLKALWAFLVAAVVAITLNFAPSHHAAPLGAGIGTTPIFPQSWSVATWYIDPTNSTTTASDGNDCQTNTTPCLTYQQIRQRWGTTAPILQTFPTVINVMSSMPNSFAGNADWIDFQTVSNPLVVLGALGSAQQQSTGTLASVVAKSNATNTMLQATLGAGAAVGQLIFNSTRTSYAWISASLGGGAFEITQPVTVSASPFFNVTGEDNGWANTNAYTSYTPVRINIRTFNPVADGVSDVVFGQIFNWSAGTNISAVFNHSQTSSAFSFRTSGSSASTLGDCDIATSNITGLPTALTNVLTINAGDMRSGGNLQGAFTFGDDFVIQSGTAFLAGTVSNNALWSRGGTFTANSQLTFGSGTVFAGTSNLNVQGTGEVLYPSGAGAAAAWFKSSGTMSIDGQTVACLITPSAGTVGACNKTISAANLDTDLGTVSGKYYVTGSIGNLPN